MEILENGEKKRMLDFDHITNDVLVAMQKVQEISTNIDLKVLDLNPSKFMSFYWIGQNIQD